MLHIRSKRHIIPSLIIVGFIWVALTLYLSKSHQKVSSGIQKEENKVETNLSIPHIDPVLDSRRESPEKSIPDGVAAHTIERVKRQLTEEELEEMKDSVIESTTNEDSSQDNETSNIESSTDDTASENKKVAFQSVEEPTNSKRKVVYGYFDSAMYTSVSVVDQLYLKKTFLRAWYAREYRPVIVSDDAFKSYDKVDQIEQITDGKRQYVAKRLAVLSALGGGKLMDVSVLFDGEKIEFDVNGDIELHALQVFVKSGVFELEKDHLDSLLERIFDNEDGVVECISGLDVKRTSVDTHAAKKVASAVQIVTSERSISCAGAPEGFVRIVNADHKYLVVENTASAVQNADVVFIEKFSHNQILDAIISSDDPQNLDAIPLLEKKVLLPANDFKQALMILEYSFGICLGDKFGAEYNPDQSKGEENIQSQAPIVAWALGKIKEMAAEISKIESQLA